MSIKIYQAARVPLNMFPEIIRLIHKKMYEQVNNVFEGFIKRTKLTHEETQGKTSFQIEKMRLEKTCCGLRDLAREKQGSLDLLLCGFTAWVHTDQYVYIVPYGANSFRRTFALLLKDNQHLEDYCYFDNVDPPENVSMKEWEIRGNKWKEIGVTENDDYEALSCEIRHKVCSAADFFDMWTLQEKYKKSLKK